jgi:nitroreductase
VDVEAAIRSRRTHKQYEPEPLEESVVRDLLDLARWAPNHKLTNPWRFRLLGPETRAAIDERAGEAEVLKLRRAPTLVLATAIVSDDPVLAEEDVLATGCAVYAVLLAATARGLASYWRTPPQVVLDVVGLGADERPVALIHLGEPASDPPPKPREPLESVYSALP